MLATWHKKLMTVNRSSFLSRCKKLSRRTIYLFISPVAREVATPSKIRGPLRNSLAHPSMRPVAQFSVGILLANVPRARACRNALPPIKNKSYFIDCFVEKFDSSRNTVRAKEERPFCIADTKRREERL